MAEQLTDVTVVSISETDSQFSFVGGTFTLGGGPFTQQTFAAQDDDPEFSSISPQPGETQGAGRQTGQIRDADGTVTGNGIASLEQVITLTHPETGETIEVGRIKLTEDDGSFGNGAVLGEYFIFSAPIDPNVTYQVTSINYSPGDGPANSYAYSEFSGSGVQRNETVCFASDTLIRTARGEVPIQALRSGDRVQTVDAGLKPVIWHGHTAISAAALQQHDHLRPVHIKVGAFGNDRPLLVSQQHRIGFRGQLIKAKHLPMIGGLPVRIARGLRKISYHHLLLEDHQILIANGVEAESLFLGSVSLRILASRGTIFDGPNLRLSGLVPGRTCRPVLPRHRVAQMTI